MTSNPSQVIVLPENAISDLVHTLYAHHSAIPEVRGEGSSPAAAATRLADPLAQTLDNAPSIWRRQIIQRAIEDVRAFAERGYL
jgi:hypothetical protein